MKNQNLESKKNEILEKTWNYLLRTGIYDASIGELCKEEKISQSSLYYWFKNKDDIWISAGKYGLQNVVESMFSHTLAHTSDMENYFKNLLDNVDPYKHDLRLAIQLTTSPVFGERMRLKAKDFYSIYENFGAKLLEIFDASPESVEIFIYTVLMAIVDYVVWDDRVVTQKILDNLADRSKRHLESRQQEKE